MIPSVREPRLKLALSQLKMGEIFFSFKPYIQKLQRHSYTVEAFKDKHLSQVSISQRRHTKIASPAQVLRRRYSVQNHWRWPAGPRGLSKAATVEGLATITVYLHNNKIHLSPSK